MNSRAVLGVVLLLGAVEVRSSEPGQPLDCSDFVFYEPGYTCTLGPDGLWTSTGSTRVIDNAGNQLFLDGPFLLRVTRVHPSGTGTLIGELRSHATPTGEVDTATAVPTCNFTSYGCNSYPWDIVGGGSVLSFDAVNGLLYIPAISLCSDPNWPNNRCGYSSVQRVFVISGFARLFDILHTYDPAVSTISFRAPALPFGLAGADDFDTYRGGLETLGDWSKVHGLQCRYPDAPPRPGDYLTVPDPLPNPEAGHGYYYVTAATYQGQTRYGRKRQGAVMSGRDPALLPACVQPEAN